MAAGEHILQGHYQWNSFRDLERWRLNALHRGIKRPDGTIDLGQARWGEEFPTQLEQLRQDGFIPQRVAIIGTGENAILPLIAAQMLPHAQIDVYELDAQKVEEAQKNAQKELGEQSARLSFIAGDMRYTMQGAIPYDLVDFGLVFQHVDDNTMQGMLDATVQHTRKGGRITVRDLTAEHWQVIPRDEGFDVNTPEDPYKRRREIWHDPQIKAEVTAQSAFIADLQEVGYNARGAELAASAERLTTRILDLSRSAENTPARVRLLPQFSRLKLATIEPGSVEEQLIQSIVDINEMVLEARIAGMSRRSREAKTLQASLDRLRSEAAVYMAGIHNPHTVSMYPGHVSQIYEIS